MRASERGQPLQAVVRQTGVDGWRCHNYSRRTAWKRTAAFSSGICSGGIGDGSTGLVKRMNDRRMKDRKQLLSAPLLSSPWIHRPAGTLAVSVLNSSFTRLLGILVTTKYVVGIVYVYAKVLGWSWKALSARRLSCRSRSGR